MREPRPIKPTKEDIEFSISCIYCSSSDNIEIEHIIPKSRGGPTWWGNTVPGCFRCNRTKRTEWWRAFIHQARRVSLYSIEMELEIERSLLGSPLLPDWLCQIERLYSISRLVGQCEREGINPTLKAKGNVVSYATLVDAQDAFGIDLKEYNIDINNLPKSAARGLWKATKEYNDFRRHWHIIKGNRVGDNKFHSTRFLNLWIALLEFGNGLDNK